MIPDSLAASLVDVCGRDGVVVERDRLLVYESDGLTAYRNRPGAVVLPRTAEEVRRSVTAIADHGLPVVPRGAGTGLSGGAAALEGAVVVGTARMNRILEIDPENRRAVLQPGVVNADLSVAAAPHGLCYPPDPSSQTACTIGGNVAENSGGPHCLKWGVTSRWVEGVTVVLPDGSTARFGGAGGDASGYDLRGLFVGSEGCFGIAVEIEVGLLPVAEGVRTLLAIFDRIEDAGRAVSAVFGAGLLPAAMEIVDGPTIRAVEDSVFAAGYPTDAEAALVVEFDGPEAGLDQDADRSAALCEEAGAREVRRARSEAERTALWKGRKKAFGAMGRLAPDLMVQDATVPRTRLPEVLKGIGETAKRFDLLVANVFHAGDGNLHPNILFDRRDAGERDRVEAASKEIMRLCIDAGGTITGEHGVGLDKKGYMSLVCGPEELRTMWGARRAFDPDGVMNPGKVLPDDSEPAGASGTQGSPNRETADRPSSIGRGSPGSAGRETAGRPPKGDRLTGVLGPYPSERLLAGEAARRWSAGVPVEAVVFPETVEEVQETVRAAAAAGVRLVPAGRGTWLRAGGWAREADVAVSTARMNAVRHYEPADLTITAGAGLGWDELAARLAPHGQWLPADPPGIRKGTLGGIVACGASGPLRARYGGVRDNVLGLELVTGEGRRLRLGGRVVKNVAGYDLVRLATGSRGSLGIVTEASVRLFPRPASSATLLFQVAPADAVATARAVCTAPLPPPLAVELWTEGGSGRTNGAPARAEATVAVRLGGTPAEVDALCGQLAAVAGTPPRRLLRDGESDAFHEERTRWEDDAQFVARASALPSQLDRALGWARRAADWLDGGRVCADAAAGVARAKGSWTDRRSSEVTRLRAEVEEAGGTLVLEKAPRALVARVGWCTGSPPAAAEDRLTRRLKALFDPGSVFAGKRP